MTDLCLLQRYHREINDIHIVVEPQTVNDRIAYKYKLFHKNLVRDLSLGEYFAKYEDALRTAIFQADKIKQDERNRVELS